MDGEYRGHGPGARHGEMSQQTPQQQDADHVQQDVDDVIAKRFETPEFVLEPERRVRDWPVVPFPFDITWREPDIQQTGPSPNRLCFSEYRVVPDKPGEQSGVEADGDYGDKRGAPKHRPVLPYGERRQCERAVCDSGLEEFAACGVCRFTAVRLGRCLPLPFLPRAKGVPVTVCHAVLQGLFAPGSDPASRHAEYSGAPLRISPGCAASGPC